MSSVNGPGWLETSFWLQLRAVLVADGIGKIAGERDHEAHGVLGHGCGEDAAGVRQDDARVAEFGVHELRNASRCGVDPLELSGVLKLLGAERGADENVGVG